MIRSLHLVLILFLVIVLLLSGLILFLYTVHLLTDQIQQWGFSDIKRVYAAIVSAESKDYYQMIVLEQQRFIPAHIIVVDDSFTLLADSHKSPQNISGWYITADISEAKQHNFGTKTIRNTDKGVLSIALSQAKKTPYGNIIIQLVYSEKRIGKLTSAFLVYEMLVVSLLALLVYLLVVFTLKRYKKPIHTLIQSTRISSGGMFSKISVDTGNSEIAQIVENFNSLVDRYNIVIESDNKKYSRINTLLANMGAGILMVDTSNTITLINPQAEKFLHLNKVDIFKNKNNSVYKDGIITEILAQTRIANTRNFQESISVSADDGRILDISIQTIFNKYSPFDRNGALVFIQDVTEVRKLERLKDEFISNVSHEFRTPLTVIAGFVETMKSWKILSRDEITSALNIIEIETDRLSRLIFELMFLSHIEGAMDLNSRIWFDPAEIVRETTEAVKQSSRKKNQTVKVRIEESVPPLFGFSNWFRQIIFNLCDNAVKYTPVGGVISIVLKELEGTVVVEIEDTGPGIPEDEREKIFERFYRIKNRKDTNIPGTGLGLAIAKQMAEEFGGSIGIVKSTNKGTLFRIAIPCLANEGE